MGGIVIGFIGLGIFGWSGSFQPERRRPEIFQGRIGTMLSWIAAIFGGYLMYRGWIRPWFQG